MTNSRRAEPTSTTRRSDTTPATPAVPTPTPSLDEIREVVRDEVSKISADSGKVVENAEPAGENRTPPPAFSLARTELAELRSLLTGSHFETGRELINAVKRVLSFMVVTDEGEVLMRVTLPEDTWERLSSRMPGDMTMEEFIGQKIPDWCQMFVDGGLP